MDKPRPRMNATIAFAREIMAMLAQTLPERHRLGMDMRLGAGRHTKTGPGRKTIHGLHRYINDHRRKDWSSYRWGSKPVSKGGAGGLEPRRMLR